MNSYKLVLSAHGLPTVTREVKAVRSGVQPQITVKRLANATRYTVKVYASTRFGQSDAAVSTVPVA